MKNSTAEGFDQPYKAPVVVAQASAIQRIEFIVATTVSNPPNDQKEVAPTRDALSPRGGKPNAGAFDHGYFSASTSAAVEARGIDPDSATGRQAHPHRWQSWFAPHLAPPPADARAKLKMAYKLQTEIGKAIYRLRKMTVEPVLGIRKEVWGFRPFSRRGLVAVAAEGCRVCVGFNRKRWHTLHAGGTPATLPRAHTLKKCTSASESRTRRTKC